ncbi:MAG: choice-of-anchor B family protein [Bacteroidota bacterium]
MKRQLLFVCTIFTTWAYAQTPCSGGMAGSFPCEGYDLISQIPLSTFNSVKANDSWGWTDPQDGKEYAIICLNEATAFIDISDPLNPVYLGQLPGESSQHTTWRDAKTYNNHVFIVSEDTGHGMQVFDLTRLRNVSNPPEIFTTDAVYNGFGNAHNIAINEATGYAYAIGTSTFSGGAHFVNIQDPVNPVAAGGHSADGYTHDAQIVTYDGPDTDYTGQEILFGSNATEIVIVDVTNKANPQTISTIDYNNVSYTHQGWLTEDHRYFLLGDETDEIDFGFNSRTLIFDFEDLDNPQFHFEYSGATGATDHNGYVKGDKFFLANNAAGLRVMDISDIANQNMVQEGYFDSNPATNSSGFTGSWNVYPFFDSGHIVISDRVEGFLLVKAPTLGIEDITIDGTITLYPNPTSDQLTIVSESIPIQRVSITDISGKMIYVEENMSLQSKVVDLSEFAEGMYFVRVNNSEGKRVIKL